MLILELGFDIDIDMYTAYGCGLTGYGDTIAEAIADWRAQQ